MTICTSVDVHQFSYGRPSVPLLRCISFHMDVHQCLCGRPLAFIQTSISISEDVYQLLYRCPSIPLWTSISFYTDVHLYLCVCQLAFIQTAISSSVVHQNILEAPSTSYRDISGPLWTPFYGIPSEHSLMYICFCTDVHRTFIDIHQFL